VIAFQRKIRGQRFAVMLVPELGGPQRKLVELPVHWILPGGAEVGTGLSWSPDGKWLAVAGDTLLNGSNRIVLVSAETGEVRPLTQLPSIAWSDYNPAFSPDGSAILFTRSLDMSTGNLYRLALGSGFSPQGDPEKIPTLGVGHPMSVAWANGGMEILFVSQLLGELYRMPITGTHPPEKLPLGTGIRSFGLSADGRRLAYSVTISDSNIWRLDLATKGASPERFISSTLRETSAEYSPDGRRIAFSSNRSLNYEIWVCDADGSKPGAITSMKQGGAQGPHWSPDGRMFLFDSVASGHYEVYTISADGGKVSQITHGEGTHFGGTWSRDGRWIYYASTAEGEPQIWKVPSQGGAPVRVTHNGGLVAIE
jgi:Tol biopolymer transport system component